MKLIIFLLLFSAAAFFSGCAKEENFNNTDTKVGISRVTFFPVLTMSGNEVMSVVKGTAFTDPGVKATEGGKDIPVAIRGTVDVNTPGFYRLTYTATNKDSFPATTERLVIVLPEEEKPGIDLSGEYLPIGGAPSNAFVTKVDKGVYFSTNIWGGGSLAVIPGYFYSTDGMKATVPLQDLNNGFGRIQSEGAGTYAGGMITWTITRLDFPGGPLTREKQWKKL